MPKTGHLFEHILTHYRGLFATLILLPVSALYSAYTSARNLKPLRKCVGFSEKSQEYLL
jgi:delta24-sterol reductase